MGFWLRQYRGRGSASAKCSTRGSFRKFGVPYFGVLIIRFLLFRVLY